MVTTLTAPVPQHQPLLLEGSTLLLSLACWEVAWVLAWRPMLSVLLRMPAVRASGSLQPWAIRSETVTSKGMVRVAGSGEGSPVDPSTERLIGKVGGTAGLAAWQQRRAAAGLGTFLQGDSELQKLGGGARGPSV